MNTRARRRFAQGAGALFAAACAAPGLLRAAPSNWPNRAVRLIVVYPPGGVSDGMARVLAEPLAQALGTPVLIENRPGAGGSLGMDALARSAPDGCTLAFSAISPLTLHPLLARVPYDPQRAFVPVASVMRTPVLVVGTPAFEGRGFGALIAQARSRPGAVRWATSGPASLGHIVLEQLHAAAGVDITHVPYKGGGQQLNDAIGGQFEVLSTNASPTLSSHIQSGKLRPLAVGAPARLDSLPQVPTLGELGYKAANINSLFGVFAPAATPAALVARYNAEINKALASPELRAKLTATDNVPTGGTSAAFAKEIASEFESNGRIVKAANIKAD